MPVKDAITELLGENWSGSLLFTNRAKARGRVYGYSWYLQANANSWLVEIAEDQGVAPEELPLVGYGCAGWLYESNKGLTINDADPDDELRFVTCLHKELTRVFSLFDQNALTYLAAVSCPCSE